VPLDIHKAQSSRRRGGAQPAVVVGVVPGKKAVVHKAIPSAKQAEEDAMLVEVLEMNPASNNNIAAGIMKQEKGEEEDGTENLVHAKGLEIV
jgi:hypothetical protein